MKIKKIDIPYNSLIRHYLPADYTDSFQIWTAQQIEASPDDIMVDFWSDMPGWVNALFKLRNFLVHLVGLKGSKNEMVNLIEDCIRSGGEYHMIKVPVKDSRETVLLLSDKHLDAYLSVLKENDQTVSVNTLVHFHNRLGKVYFFFIKPFHGVIVREILKRTIKKYISKNKYVKQ